MATFIPTLIFDPMVNGWICKVPYDPKWINDLKFKVPGAARVWNKDKKVWIVDDMFIETIRQLCTTYFGSYKEMKNDPPPPPPAAVATHFENFIRLCSHEDVKKLYRNAALLCHPDRNGGNGEKMSQLNISWEAIKRDLGW